MATPETDAMPEVLTIDRPEQLKALGHPLRLRVLEALGETDEALSNRELAQKLGVDPGHLHFHVRMLLHAGLIQQVAEHKGREKPYRAAAKTLKVAPELVSAGRVGPPHGDHARTCSRPRPTCAPRASSGSSGSTCASIDEKALEVLSELVPRFEELEDEDADLLTITAIMHPHD